MKNHLVRVKLFPADRHMDGRRDRRMTKKHDKVNSFF
jgi:hypothetical protein